MHVGASAPVLVQTSGGNEMNDWGTFLRPVPPADGPFDCPDLEIDLQVPADAGAPTLDAGPDAAPDAGAAFDAGQDAAPDAPDAARPRLVARGGGCDCRAAPEGRGPGWLALAAIGGIAALTRVRPARGAVPG